ncbi:hypothetical protein TWF173_011353 [Orbilia oligospora]|nr:hypothetical protein TWF173_011353 [Orbilia oligospora]
MVYEDSNSDFSSYDEVPEFSGLTGDQAPAPSPSTDTVTCQASQIQPANAGSHGSISVSPNLDSGPHHILETENTPQAEAKDEFSDGNESEDLQYQSSAGSSTIHSSSTRNILQKAHNALSHPVATSRKFKAHHYHTHHERKGKRKPQRLCQELAKAEAGSARPIMSPTNKSNSSSHPVKSKVKHVVSSFSKSHPKRLTKVLASNTLSNHILGLDLDPFRLTKSDVEFIQLVSKRRFETDGQVISEREQRLRELKIARQKMLVNWVSDRHIRSASVVRAKALKYPDLDKTIEEEGFMKYFGDVALYFSQRFIPIYTSPWEEIPRFGSWAQLKLGDFADALEIIRNFYEWRDPEQTVFTLIFFGACLLIGMFTSMAYCWRIVTFVFGLWFFISSPIASRYPRYRLVVSPFKWIFWGIPTHADIAYSEFRADAANAVSDPDMKKKSAKRNAKRRRAADFETPVMVIDDDVEDEEGGDDGYTTSPDLDEDDNYDPEELISPHDMERDPESLGGKQYIGVIYCGFRCIYRGHPGKLYLSDYGLVFETEVSKKVMLEIKWRDVKKIEKEESLSMGKVGKVHALGVAMACGERIKFEAMLKRDLAFNRIIGFSGLQWQSEA